MTKIEENQKVAELLDRYPHTYQVFRSHGCPDMRSGFFSFMARIMSIRNAARIHRIPIDQLLTDLEASIEQPDANKEIESELRNLN